jgi:hypothetical protein
VSSVQNEIQQEKIIQGKLSAARPTQVSDDVITSSKKEAKYIRYTPNEAHAGGSAAFNSGAKQVSSSITVTSLLYGLWFDVHIPLVGI